MIVRICRWLLDVHPWTALCFVLGGFIAAASVDQFAPDAALYWVLGTCLNLPTRIWPGVIVDGIETRSDTRECRNSILIWTLIGFSIPVALMPLPPPENIADAFRITTVPGIVGWWLPLLLDMCVCWIATGVLTGAEREQQTVSTGPTGTFLQFVFVPLCVYFLQRRAQRLVRPDP